MMKTHILVFDGIQVEKDVFRDAIDSLQDIENWTLFFGNTMCVVSNKSARELSTAIQSILPKVRFLIMTVDPQQKGGWLPQTLWQFMNEPAPFRVSTDA